MLAHDLMKSFVASWEGRSLISRYLDDKLSRFISSSDVMVRQEYAVADGFIDVALIDKRRGSVIAFEIKTGSKPSVFISQVDRYYEHLTQRFRKVIIIGIVPTDLINAITVRLAPHLKERVILLPLEPLLTVAFKHLIKELKFLHSTHNFSIFLSINSYGLKTRRTRKCYSLVRL